LRQRYVKKCARTHLPATSPTAVTADVTALTFDQLPAGRQRQQALVTTPADVRHAAGARDRVGSLGQLDILAVLLTDVTAALFPSVARTPVSPSPRRALERRDDMRPR
jgi:hypothetical protein